MKTLPKWLNAHINIHPVVFNFNFTKSIETLSRLLGKFQGEQNKNLKISKIVANRYIQSQTRSSIALALLSIRQIDKTISKNERIILRNILFHCKVNPMRSKASIKEFWYRIVPMKKAMDILYLNNEYYSHIVREVIRKLQPLSNKWNHGKSGARDFAT